MSRRQPWLDWPITRLHTHAEAHREDREALSAILLEARQRGTPAGDELATRVHGMLMAIGVFDEEDENAADLAAQLHSSQLRNRELREQLVAAERRAREAEARAAQSERRAQAILDSVMTSCLGQHGLHERVHLAPTAPAWMIEAVQRAFRQRFHPDRFGDPDVKLKAESIFKEAEVVFARLRIAA